MDGFFGIGNAPLLAQLSVGGLWAFIAFGALLIGVERLLFRRWLVGGSLVTVGGALHVLLAWTVLG